MDPKRHCSGSQRRSDLHVAVAGECPFEAGTDIAEVSAIAFLPIGLRQGIALCLSLNEGSPEVFRMATCGLPVLSRAAQLLEGVGARRVQQAIVVVPGLKIGDDERLDHQARKIIGDRHGVEISYHRGSGIERKIAVEHRHVAQHPRLCFRQQFVAPIEGRKQGLVPRQCRPEATGQQVEAIVQARRDLLQADRCDASSREFDGQRDAIELTRNRSDQLKVFPAWQEVGVQCFCPGNQELHCAACEDIVISISALCRNIKRGNAIDILAIDSKHLAAGRQNLCIWTESHERVRQPRSPFNEMLAIVQHEQEFSCSDFPSNGFEGNPVAALSKVENSRNHKWHQSRI